jgi:hypothetical protein
VYISLLVYWSVNSGRVNTRNCLTYSSHHFTPGIFILWNVEQHLLNAFISAFAWNNQFYAIRNTELQNLAFANLKPGGNFTADVLELLGWEHISKLLLIWESYENAWKYLDPLCFTNRKLHGNSVCQSIGQQNPCQLFLWLYKRKKHIARYFYSGTVIVFRSISGAPAGGSGAMQGIIWTRFESYVKGKEERSF